MSSVPVVERAVRQGDLHQTHFNSAASRLSDHLGHSHPRAVILERRHVDQLVSTDLDQSDVSERLIAAIFQLDPTVSRRRMTGSLHFEGTTVEHVQLESGPGIVIKKGPAADREVQTHAIALESDEMGAYVLPLIGSRELSFMVTPYLGDDAKTIRDTLREGGYVSLHQLRQEQDEIVGAFTRWAGNNLVSEHKGPVISMQRLEWQDQTLPALRASVAQLEQYLEVPPGRLWDAELVFRTRTRRGHVQEERYPSIGEMEAEISPTVAPDSRPRIMAVGIDQDQSPKNWFRTPYGRIKIDFGYAALKHEVTDVAEGFAVALKGVSLATATHVGGIHAYFEEGPDGRGRLIVDQMDVSIAPQALEWQRYGIKRLGHYAQRLGLKGINRGIFFEEFWMRFATNALHEVAYIQTRMPQRPEAALFMLRESGRAFSKRDRAKKRYSDS